MLTVYLYCSPVVGVLIGMVVCDDCISILFSSGRCIGRDGVLTVYLYCSPVVGVLVGMVC